MSAPSRGEIVRLARGWIGTPYCHRASTKGAGCDCLGLLLGIWRERSGPRPSRLPEYGAGWSELDAGERLWTALALHLCEMPRDAELLDGQVLLFRMRTGAAARHLGILAHGAGGDPHFIHAYERHGVIESPLSTPWRRRIVARFELV